MARGRTLIRNLLLWTLTGATFLPSDNRPWKSYKSCGYRSGFETIDEPVFGGSSGGRKANTKIYNGRGIFTKGEWPWFASILESGTESFIDPKVKCMGVLINCNTVLTTASCGRSVSAGDQVRIGSPVAENSTVDRKINKVVVHPGFTTTRNEHTVHYNNVAVLFVDSPVSDDILYEENMVSPVCMTEDASFLTSKCWALGVTTSPGSTTPPYLSTAVQLDVERQSLKYCNAFGYGGELDADQHACVKAKWSSENQGFCNLADNGAPVVCKRDNSQNEFFLLGMYSFSEGCTTFPRPAIFQKTDFMDEWIQKTILRNSKCSCVPPRPGPRLDVQPDMCCLNFSYNSGMKECCGGKLIEKDSSFQCCSGVPFDSDSYRCSPQDGSIIKL
jgi:hypothetical protein